MKSARLLVLPAALLLAAGCQSGYDMRDQPSYRTYSASTLFSDSTSARPLVPGVVDRSRNADAESFYTGSEAGTLLARIPLPVTPALIQRGHERYDIYCSPCHGLDGYGHGMVVARGFTPPPSFHSDSLRAIPVGMIYQVISYGLGRMPSYRAQIEPADRWAVAAYVRVLQLSQHAPVGELPPELRGRIEGAR